MDGQRDDRTGGALSGKCRSTCGSGCGIEPTRSGGAAIMAKIKEGLGERSTKLHKRPRCRRAALVKMWVGTRGWAVGYSTNPSRGDAHGEACEPL